MEELRGRGRLHHLNVVIGSEFEKTFHACARMLRALTLHSVGQQQGNAAQPSPFVFRRSNELIDDHLSDIPEIPELSFPCNESIGSIQAVAVFKSEHARFRKRTVVDLNTRLIGS